jgi:hypothetical protein
MKEQQLEEYAQTEFLDEGDPELLDAIRPAFIELINDLRQLPETASELEKLAPFAKALASTNQFEEEIETVEREAILNAIYAIGQIVGFPRQSEFAEEWRGDW